MINSIILFIFFLLIGFFTTAQSIYNFFGPNQLRDLKLASNYFSLINPHELSTFLMDSLTGSKSLKIKVNSLNFSFNPLSIQHHSNSVIPTNFTNNYLIPNVGIQKVLSSGLKLEYKKSLEVSFQPVYQTAQNLPFDQYPIYNREWNWYYYYLNRIDLPNRFSTTPVKRNLLGPSYIRYKYKQIAFTMSNENKWWGPAYFNPLVLGSNPPGFLHTSVRSFKPLSTPIGYFDFETIFGVLYRSGYFPPDTNRVNTLNGTRLYIPKQVDDRYINGITYTYSPTWSSNLKIGFTKLSMLYKSDIKNIYDILPVDGFIGRNISRIEKQSKKASMGSWFIQYLMPRSHAEVYAEFGRGDQSLHIWNILQNNAYSRGFTIGLKKGYQLNKFPGHFIQFGTEFTNLSLPTRELVKSEDPKSWYIHDYVRQGFTHKGIILGSQLGPGGNSQNIYLQYVHKLNKIGIRFFRNAHNLDYYYFQNYNRINFFAHYWISIGSVLYTTLHLKKFGIQTFYGLQRDLNYQWDWIRYRDVGVENIGSDKFNVSLNILLSYRL